MAVELSLIVPAVETAGFRVESAATANHSGQKGLFWNPDLRLPTGLYLAALVYANPCVGET